MERMNPSTFFDILELHNEEAEKLSGDKSAYFGVK